MHYMALYCYMLRPIKRYGKTFNFNFFLIHLRDFWSTYNKTIIIVFFFFKLKGCTFWRTCLAGLTSMYRYFDLGATIEFSRQMCINIACLNRFNVYNTNGFRNFKSTHFEFPKCFSFLIYVPCMFTNIYGISKSV